MDIPRDVNHLWAENDLCEWLGLAVKRSGRSRMLSNWINEGLKYIEKSDKRYFFEQDVLEYVLKKFQPT